MTFITEWERYLHALQGFTSSDSQNALTILIPVSRVLLGASMAHYYGTMISPCPFDTPYHTFSYMVMVVSYSILTNVTPCKPPKRLLESIQNFPCTGVRLWFGLVNQGIYQWEYLITCHSLLFLIASVITTLILFIKIGNPFTLIISKIIS